MRLQSFVIQLDLSMSHVHQRAEAAILNPLSTDLVIILRGVVTLMCTRTSENCGRQFFSSCIIVA